MRKLFASVLALNIALAVCGERSAPANAAVAARIDEIAQWLPEKPRADGAPACDRAKWDSLAATKEGQTVIRNAEKISGEPVPDTPDDLYLEFSKNGNRSNYQKCFFRRKANFVWLYVGECLERKGRFIPKIVAYMDAFCAMKSWTLPAHDGNLTCFNGTPHVDLCSSELSRELAYCLSWLGDVLPAATREKVYSEIDRRTFQPHLAHARGERKLREHWWFHGGNNWNSVCNCCVVRAALALVPDRRLRAEFVMYAEGSVPFALRGYTDDGYCSEGMGYWNYGYGHHIMMGLSLRAATGGKVDLFADPKTKTVMEYAYGFQLQSGRSPHFADGGGNPSPVLLALGRQIWPDLVSTSALKSPAFGFDTAQSSLRAFGQEPAPCAPTMDVLPVRTWFPNAQVLISDVRRPRRGGLYAPHVLEGPLRLQDAKLIRASRARCGRQVTEGRTQGRRESDQDGIHGRQGRDRARLYGSLRRARIEVARAHDVVRPEELHGDDRRCGRLHGADCVRGAGDHVSRVDGERRLHPVPVQQVADDPSQDEDVGEGFSTCRVH